MMAQSPSVGRQPFCLDCPLKKRGKTFPLTGESPFARFVKNKGRNPLAWDGNSKVRGKDAVRFVKLGDLTE